MPWDGGGDNGYKRGSAEEDRMRPALRIAGALIALYLMLAFVLMSTYEFLRCGVLPVALIIVVLGILYGERRRSAARTGVRVLVDAPPGHDAAQSLEKDLDQLREAASRDPSRMPRLALRLLALSSLYEIRDPDRSRSYLEEALEVVSSRSYPAGEEAIAVREAVLAAASSRGLADAAR